MNFRIRLLSILALVALAGCSTLQPRPDLLPEVAIAAGSGAPLDDLIGAAEANHPGQSGFRLVSEGPEAFAIRARTAQAAGRSLDVQTYIWHDDPTGAYLAYRLLEAADRGVKVRLLVDDMDGRGKNLQFAALDAHPNIEVRMFNPFGTRTGSIAFAIEAIGRFGRINHRMHNKSWIADNRIAIVGGRNLGDEYFGASDEVNFSDLDFAMVGPIVRDASASFDRYWNSHLAYPVALLSPDAATTKALEDLRTTGTPRIEAARQSRYASELHNADSIQRLVAGDWPMHWTPHFQFVADDPAKAAGKRKNAGIAGSQVLGSLGPLIGTARERLTIISPYFVPGQLATQGLVKVAQAGAQVRILTNSLAANDVAVVYGGYSKWRTPLLKGGVRLWELKPTRGSNVQSSMFGSSGASLHTKALAVDGSKVFVGSYNLDPRSTSLNCEQGVFVDDPEIAAQLEQIFTTETSPTRAWSVTLRDGETIWSDGTQEFDDVPDASAGRRFQAWLARVLPMSSQL